MVKQLNIDSWDYEQVVNGQDVLLAQSHYSQSGCLDDKHYQIWGWIYIHCMCSMVPAALSTYTP